ncbi:MAG: PstS family phosphate ABC transporter substrate-binding protein [Nitrospinota bacterium]|nr:PstS family phosphate ABC transporter substrate-binding protein [Nitrospinota bacterium]
MFKGSSIVLAGILTLLISGTGFAGSKELKGTVKVDGSSTVFPITEAVAEEFGMLKEHRRVRVTVGVSGTGGGFKKFLAGETDINDASRPIKQQEINKAQKNGIQYLELPVAYDGLSVVVNKANTWVDYLTVAELHKIWKPGSTVKTWKDIRPNWPDQKIQLYGPGTDSGTFDYFTETINGKSQASRSDFTKSEDDNVLVNGVAGDKGSLGYFGFAYYVENKDKIKVVPVKQGDNKPVAPTLTTINNGSYAPLSRPIFIYVNLHSAKKPEVREFIRFYLKHAKELAKEVGYVPLTDQEYQKYLDQFEHDFLKLAES